MSFSKFTSLPPELQALIYEECLQGPSMHIFDVRFPSWRRPSNRVNEERYGQTAFLDALDTSEEEMNRVTRVGKYAFDPSMYRMMRALLGTSKVAAGMVRYQKLREETNTMYLPARNQKVTVPQSDVLMLRFRDAGAATQCAAQILFAAEATSPAAVRKCTWSPAMAATVHAARKLALDVSEGWTAWAGSVAGDQEIAYLASTMQSGLEVLYLVDACAGRCAGCRREGGRGAGERDGVWRGVNGEEGEERQGDVIQGVSKRYVEVFDLARLGWNTSHPSFIFAQKMARAIRSQQHGDDEGRFQGVRVLIVEDEKLDNVNTELRVDCKMKGVVDGPMELLNQNNLMAFSSYADADALGASGVEGRIFRMALGWDYDLFDGAQSGVEGSC